MIYDHEICETKRVRTQILNSYRPVYVFLFFRTFFFFLKKSATNKSSHVYFFHNNLTGNEPRLAVIVDGKLCVLLFFDNGMLTRQFPISRHSYTGRFKFVLVRRNVRDN